MRHAETRVSAQEAAAREGAGMARYAVLRIAKVKTMGHVAGLGLHVERERETRNADEERRAHNERLAGTGDWCADVERRLADAPTMSLIAKTFQATHCFDHIAFPLQL